MTVTLFCLASGMFHNENAEEAQRPYSGDEDENEAEVNGNWTPQEKALHEARLKAKAKRRQRKSSSRNSTSESFSEPGEVAGGDPHSPKGKVHTNDRKSRTGKGRGLPKKGLFGLECGVQLPVFVFLFFFKVCFVRHPPFKVNSEQAAAGGFWPK